MVERFCKLHVLFIAVNRAARVRSISFLQAVNRVGFELVFGEQPVAGRSPIPVSVDLPLSARVVVLGFRYGDVRVCRAGIAWESPE
ncbi:hypothetical protein SDC9_83664 [bioreactor metagenome]|uniref:Uncharacterized protein n=1 Tax=bioreactor metagenome TaxID=1076179 RepID=A0A644Z8U1_9ZZZZ